MTRKTGFGGRVLGLAIPLLGLLIPLSVHAATQVTITGCTISTPASMVFNTNLVSGLTTTTSFTVSCTTNGGTAGNATFTIGLSAGSSGTVTQRTLKNGTNVLTYNFYQDASFATPWGVTNNLYSQKITSNITNQLITIYGKIDNSAANLAKPPGPYSDPTITATISW